jgi:hypothetical protein
MRSNELVFVQADGYSVQWKEGNYF